MQGIFVYSRLLRIDPTESYEGLCMQKKIDMSRLHIQYRLD